MGDDLESKRSGKEMVNSAFDSRIPRDLLQRFGNLKQSGFKQEGDDGNENENDESDDLELNLGLSLGGRFGVNKTSNSLVRSSSIAGPIPLVRDEIEAVTPPAVAVPPYASLVRTSSLPVETEEEWRKRKEIQSLRRMAAKRRRSEKQRAGKGGGGGGDVEVNSKGKGERDQYIADMTKVGSSATPQFGLPSWAAAAKQAILGVGIEALIGRGKINNAFGDGGSGSITKEAIGLELEKKPVQGRTSGDMSQPSALPSVPDQNNQTVMDSAGTQGANIASKPSGAEMDDLSKSSDAAASRGKNELNSLEDMPSVFTKGDGPNGRRIEGILYKYGKGEDVRIMCVCHGTFHSPAGFVKHAGGTDINHPLKHIVVNPNPSFS